MAMDTLCRSRHLLKLFSISRQHLGIPPMSMHICHFTINFGCLIQWNQRCVARAVLAL